MSTVVIVGAVLGVVIVLVCAMLEWAVHHAPTDPWDHA